MMKKELINLDEIKQYKNDKLVIAVSTGIDSMCLFHYLYNHGFNLVVAHVNHKRRAESDMEYKYLEELCQNLNVPFEGYVLNETIDNDFQEKARYIRYDFFMETAKKHGAKGIVLAHQEDDMVETILMRLTRGTSIKGYSGIKKHAELMGIKILRPLLETPRASIAKYQLENNIKYFEDSSNNEDHYTRNIYRHNIVPKLKEINPNLYDAFNNYRTDLEEMSKLVDDLSLDFIRNHASVKKNNFVEIEKKEFNSLENIVKKEVILNAVNILTHDTVEITHEKANEIVKMAMLGNEAKTIEIKGVYVVNSDFDKIVFRTREMKDPVHFEVDSFGEYDIIGYGKVIISQKYHLLPSKISHMLCYNMENDIFPITIRNFSNGDKISYSNITKKVSDLLKEHKVPLEERKATLVFENEKDGIFFIPDIIRKETDTEKTSKLYITFLKDEKGR